MSVKKRVSRNAIVAINAHNYNIFNEKYLPRYAIVPKWMPLEPENFKCEVPCTRHVNRDIHAASFVHKTVVNMTPLYRKRIPNVATYKLYTVIWTLLYATVNMNVWRAAQIQIIHTDVKNYVMFRVVIVKYQCRKLYHSVAMTSWVFTVRICLFDFHLTLHAVNRFTAIWCLLPLHMLQCSAMHLTLILLVQGWPQSNLLLHGSLHM